MFNKENSTKRLPEIFGTKKILLLCSTYISDNYCQYFFILSDDLVCREIGDFTKRSLVETGTYSIKGLNFAFRTMFNSAYITLTCIEKKVKYESKRNY